MKKKHIREICQCPLGLNFQLVALPLPSTLSLCPTWQLPNAPKMIGQCVFLPAKMKNIMGKSYGGIIVPLCAPLYTIVHRSVPLYNFVQLHLENWNLLLHWERTTSTASISVSVFLIINHILLLIFVFFVLKFNLHPHRFCILSYSMNLVHHSTLNAN